MKTMRLTKPESAAYTNGERRFWRSMKPLPGCCVILIEFMDCPYGKPGDRIELVMRECPGAVQATITAITVEQRGGKWGWAVEVWA